MKRRKKMKLDKRLVDEVIRLTKKYYETNDTDYLQPLVEAKRVLRKTVSWQVVEWQAIELVSDLAQYTQLSRKGTYDDIYKALAVFDIEVIEVKENE